MNGANERVRRAWDRALERAQQRRRRMARMFPRRRTRFSRRVFVVLWLSIPAALAIMTCILQWGRPWLAWVYIALLVSWFPLWLLLRVLTTATADAHAALLDERELQLRNRCIATAFAVLLISNFLVVQYMSWFEDTDFVTDRALVLLVCSMLLSVSVPTSLLAWRMPDDDPEDLDGLHPIDLSTPGAENNREGESRA